MSESTLIDVPSAPTLVRTLTERGETLAFCESLTAGLACSTVASVPGASHVLRGGLVTYATDLKEALAGVPSSILETHGPVAASTARHMARGAQKACGATWGVALTGVAGPDSQDGHPVGEVHIAVAGPSRTVSHPASAILADIANHPELTRFALAPDHDEPVRVVVGNRQEIRQLSVAAAMVAVMHEVNREQNEGENR